MMYLLDTCVISELVALKPSQLLTSWILQQNEDTFYVSVLTVGELRRGIFGLPKSAKKDRLAAWFESEFLERFSRRVIPVDIDVAIAWGELIAAAAKRGRPLPSIDSLILASALTRKASIVTRNVKDFEGLGVEVVNPWSA